MWLSSSVTISMCGLFPYHRAILQYHLAVLCAYVLSHSVVSDSLRPRGLQHSSLPCPSPTPRAYSNSCPLRWWYHPTILYSVIPFSSCPSPSWHQGLFQWVNSSHEVAKVLEFQLQHQSLHLTWSQKAGVSQALTLKPLFSSHVFTLSEQLHPFS